MTTTIGIDIGGTKIAAGLYQLTDSLTHVAVSPTPAEPMLFIDTLVEHIERLRQLNPEVSAVGIATAGVVDSLKGEVLGATDNLPALSGIKSIRQSIENRIQLPVYVENDANAAAYGECRGGAAHGYENVLMVTLGTGVGTGLVVNNRLIAGAHYYAGEGGHIALSMNQDRRCTCGRWDCWEAYASGTGLNQTIRLTMEQVLPFARTAHWRGLDNEGMTTHHLFTGVGAADPLALTIMDTWHEHIAAGLASILNLLDPEIVVIGGGLAGFVDLNQLTQRTRPRSMNPDIRLVKATLGNQAGMVGVAHIAQEKFSQTLSAN